MKIYTGKTVLEAARERVAFIFDEFPEIVVGFSGGKDSTVIFHLCLEEARRRDRLPLRVLWIDQEAEWQGTVDFVTSIMTRPDVLPMWFQIPMVITNNASSFARFNYCWREEDREKWIHPQHPISIKVNKYGTDRFHDLFDAIIATEFPTTKTCIVGGVRASEAPKRASSLTNRPKYKWVTWGKTLSEKKQHYTLYPIYDWRDTDVWKFIADNDYHYNRVYDQMYRFGLAPRDMRVSNLHHETAIQHLLEVQEIEPLTWAKLTRRIDGANTVKQLKYKSFTCPDKLPPMFDSWQFYAEHLIENIIQEETNKEDLRRFIRPWVELYEGGIREKFFQVVINTVLSSDWDFTKLNNFILSPDTYGYKNWKKWMREGGPMRREWTKNKWIPEEERQKLTKIMENAA